MIDIDRVIAELSPLARELLAKLNCERVPGWTVPPDELVPELSAMGWPCSKAVVRSEEAMGGVALFPVGIFGVYASLRYLRGEGSFQRDENQDYALRADPRDGGGSMLPVSLTADPRLWLALDGVVFYGSHIDGPVYLSRAFEDVCHFWEVLALLDGFIVAFARPWLKSSPRLEASAFVGEAIARELTLTPFPPATRGTTRAWIGPGIRTVELDIPGFVRGTRVVSDSAEGIVLAAASALAGGGAARVTVPEALDHDLLAMLPVCSTTAFGLSLEYTWGKFTDYSDARYRRRQRESLREADR